MHSRRSRFIALSACALLLVLGGCGAAGGAGGGNAGAGLVITTTSLPDGTTAQPYSASQLEVAGAQGTVTWDVIAGALPSGLGLDAGGVISGQPSVNGTFDFTVEATDDADTATRELQIEIADLMFTVTDGLVAGDAWTGKDVSVATSGSSNTISFSVAFNASGGSFTSVNGQAGTAVWTPGPTGGVTVTDTLRATDDVTSETVELDIDVRVDPTASHASGFGTNDVWYVETDKKRGSHAYQTDLHDALVSLGLWPAGSTGPATTDLEILVETCVRLQILREMNLVYLRNDDGTEGSDGLSISFPFDKPPTPPYTAPATGQSLTGASTRFSVMEVADGVNVGSTVLGTAFLDPGNPFHDHNGGSGLGIFIDHITEFFVDVHASKTITNNPINDNDIDILRALIYEDLMIGTRYNTIRTLVLYYARAVALVASHEIGHSLGLDHNGQSGTLMAASISFGTTTLAVSNGAPLTQSEIATLESGDLPGPGRSTAPLTLFGKETPKDDGEVCVCHHAPVGSRR